MQLTKELSISGMPVVDGSELVGIVTSRDFRYADNLSDPVSTIMTPKEKLITVIEGTDQEEVKKLMYNNRIEKVLVVDSKGLLTGLVTMKDIKKSAEHPFATKDSRGQLRVGAALGTGEDTLKRAKLLANAGVDLFVVDSAHGHSKKVIDTVKLIKKEFKDIDVMGGNVATPEGALALIDAGADAVKIGMGPGSICTTRIISGMGVPQITAILSIKEKVQSSDVPLIADGGIRFSGDIAKAIAAGADAVMLGSIFAGTNESPGEEILWEGRSFKSFRGMGSIAAMNEGSKDRYFQNDTEARKLVPEGIEGMVPFRGSVKNTIHQLLGGIRSSMGYCGSKTIEEFGKNTTFVQITAAGVKENHPHEVRIVKEAPNYQVSDV